MKPINGTLSVALPQIEVAPAMPPHTYIAIAFSMLPGAQALSVVSPLPAIPLALVSAHALECALKAYLSRSGDDSHLKKAGVRHNLKALWSLAQAEGLNIQNEPPQWVECLSNIHNSPYHLRYSTGVHGISTPATEPMTTELAALISLVQSQLQI